MKKLLLVLVLGMTIFSCSKEELTEGLNIYQTYSKEVSYSFFRENGTIEIVYYTGFFVCSQYKVNLLTTNDDVIECVNVTESFYNIARTNAIEWSDVYNNRRWPNGLPNN